MQERGQMLRKRIFGGVINVGFANLFNEVVFSFKPCKHGSSLG